MKNQTYRMSMLFDFYGELLTDRQKEFFDLYYNEDLSLAEIAEHAGISRQGVRDVMDKYAPGGGWGIGCWPVSYAGDPVLPEIKRILRDECHWYGRKVYGYKD